MTDGSKTMSTLDGVRSSRQGIIVRDEVRAQRSSSVNT